MKLVIDIPKEMIEAAKTDLWCGSPTLGYAIKRGTPYEERLHGEWRDYSDEGFVECPFCEHATTCDDNIDELHYCFFCGADMKKRKNGEAE